MFDFFKKKDDQSGENLPEQEKAQEEKKNIFTNVRSLVVYKFGNVILDGTDNIIISSTISTAVVGLVSNYTLIINAVKGILGKITNAVTSSIGNLNAMNDNAKKEEVLYDYLFVAFWIYGLSSIGMGILFNDFIEIWIGKEYILSIYTVIALVFSFFVDGMHYPAYTYRVTMGLFKEGKKAPFFTAIINVILSIVMGNMMGVTGVFLATSISRLLTTTWYDPYLIFKKRLNLSAKKFVVRYVQYFIIFVVVGIISYFTINLIGVSGILGFLIKGIIAFIEINLLFLGCFFKRREFKNTIDRLKIMIKEK